MWKREAFQINDAPVAIVLRERVTWRNSLIVLSPGPIPNSYSTVDIYPTNDIRFRCFKYKKGTRMMCEGGMEG